MARKFKVMITTKLFAFEDEEVARIFDKAHCEVVRSTLRSPIKAGELAAVIKGIDALIVGSDAVDRPAIDAADKLKIVCMHGIGMDTIDIGYAKSKGIITTNLPGVNADAVAELALGLAIALSRNIVGADRQFREGHWRRQVGNELIGKTMGIIGLGAIGKALAKKCRCLGLKVIAYNRSKDEEFISSVGASYIGIDELLESSDFISLHVPHTAETHDIINARALSMMKKGAFLINTSRGGLINEGALFDCLKSGHLGGAALDVFEKEPVLGDSPFAELPNCILTPHMGGQTQESLLRSSIASARIVAEALTSSIEDL